MKPLCDLCRTRHESYQAHVFASNKVTASNTHASNRDSAVAVVPEIAPERAGDEGAVGDGDSKQRWSRDSYNAYQREYMRKRRLAGKH